MSWEFDLLSGTIGALASVLALLVWALVRVSDDEEARPSPERIERAVRR